MEHVTPKPGGAYSDEEAGTWRKSSWSLANGNCVEVGRLAGELIGVRNSRDPHGDVLRFSRAGWRNFLAGVRESEFGPR
jgi:hypothetical protein